MRMEYVALALALVLSVLGVALVTLGTGRLYAPSLRDGRRSCCPPGRWLHRDPPHATSPPRAWKAG